MLSNMISDTALNDYRYIWSKVIDQIPSIELLRGPIEQASDISGGDLDLLVDPSLLNELSSILETSGFIQIKSLYSYRHSWTRICPGKEPLTVDAYTSLSWGKGIYLSNDMDDENPVVRRFMRAVYDKKDADYFSERFSLVDLEANFDFGILDKLIHYMFYKGYIAQLGLLLLLSLKVRIGWSVYSDHIVRRIASRFSQIFNRQGFEVALVGVDGSGKTSLSNRLQSELYISTKSIYMGSSAYVTSIMRLLVKMERPPSAIYLLCASWEFFVRRSIGRFYAHRGYVVLYDRHPVERIRLDKGPKSIINNFLVRSYLWKIDKTYWLDGDLSKIFARKNEHGVEILGRLRDELVQKMGYRNIKYISIDSVLNDQDTVYQKVESELIEFYLDKKKLQEV